MEKQYSEFGLFEDNLKLGLSSFMGIVKTPQQMKKAFDRYRYLRQQEQLKCQSKNNK